MNLEMLIFVGGLLHFGILIASALVPQVLDWKGALAQLDPLFRQLVWVHGVFIVLVIVGFGVLSLGFARDLADGSPLARGVCGFVAVFWALRLVTQFFVFDASKHLTKWWLRAGYHGLTAVFAYHVVVYGAGALSLGG